MLRALIAFSVLVPCLPATGDGCFIGRPSRRDIYEPTQKALILFQNGIQDLVLQVKYTGADADFAWIVPTPSRPSVNLADPGVFAALSIATNPQRPSKGGGGLGGGSLGGPMGPSVHVIEQKTVGVYDVAVLAANDSSALISWLDRHGYAVAPRLVAVVEEYIRRGFYFTSMRIDPARNIGTESEKKTAITPDGTLQPIRLTFRAASPIYPLKISSLNGGVSELLIYLMTPMPVNPAGLRQEYSERKRAKDLNNITRSNPLVQGDLWLTRLSAKMPTSSMTHDLQFTFGHPSALKPLGSRP